VTLKLLKNRRRHDWGRRIKRLLLIKLTYKDLLGFTRPVKTTFDSPTPKMFLLGSDRLSVLKLRCCCTSYKEFERRKFS